MSPHWTGFFVGVGATFLISSLSSYRAEEIADEKLQKEQQRVREVADLLSDTLKYGCDKMDDYHDKVQAGLTLRDLAEPNIRKRSMAETLAREQRFKEGKQTEQDIKFKKRIEEEERRRQEEKRRKEEAERARKRRLEEMEKEWKREDEKREERRREDKRLDLQESQVKALTQIARNVKKSNRN